MIGKIPKSSKPSSNQPNKARTAGETKATSVDLKVTAKAAEETNATTADPKVTTKAAEETNATTADPKVTAKAAEETSDTAANSLLSVTQSVAQLLKASETDLIQAYCIKKFRSVLPSEYNTLPLSQLLKIAQTTPTFKIQLITAIQTGFGLNLPVIQSLKGKLLKLLEVSSDE